MRRPEGGGWRCSYGTWHGIDEHCRCAPSSFLADAVMVAAFGGSRRIAGSSDVLCGDRDCGCLTRGSRDAA